MSSETGAEGEDGGPAVPPDSDCPPSPEVDIHEVLGLPRPKRPSERSEEAEEVEGTFCRWRCWCWCWWLLKVLVEMPVVVIINAFVTVAAPVAVAPMVAVCLCDGGSVSLRW